MLINQDFWLMHNFFIIQMYKTSKKTGKNVEFIGFVKSYSVNLILCMFETSLFLISNQGILF